MEKEGFIPYTRESYDQAEMIRRSEEFYQWMDTRRSLRVFSDKEVPREVIENIIQAASTAPSGAHKQPWTFCAVSDPDIKSKIREQQRRRSMKTITEECLTAG